MTRPHTVFIQSQCIPWKKNIFQDIKPNSKTKILSIDKKNGDLTCIIKYPSFFSRNEKEFLYAHEELFVLHGEIKINNISYKQHSYAFLPAGFLRKTIVSEKGAIILTTFSCKPISEKGNPPKSLYDKKLLIEYINTLEMEWDSSLVDPQLASGVAIKPLRTDPYTKETSFIYSSAAHRIPKSGKKPQWTHSIVEEIFVIDGEYIFADVGVMGPGAYAWWRENILHGPSGSIAGFNLWVRTINGPMNNKFEKKKIFMNWQPKYKPILPKELKKIAKKYTRPRNY